METGDPLLPCPASGPLHAWETGSTALAGRDWASVCAMPALTPSPTPAAGVAGYAPTLNRRALARLSPRRRAFALPAISRRLPRRCADCLGPVLLTGRRLDALSRRAASLPGGPPAPPCRGRQRGCAPDCLLRESDALTAFVRQYRLLSVTASRKRRPVSWRRHGKANKFRGDQPRKRKHALSRALYLRCDTNTTTSPLTCFSTLLKSQRPTQPDARLVAQRSQTR